MSRLLDEAFAAATQLPDAEQDALASWLLEELAGERRWQATLTSSADALARLAQEALIEHRGGQTRLLNPDSQ